jgi:uncharacterized protein YjlB
MTEPETYTFDDDGVIPNSRLPLLLYRGALPAEARAIEQTFTRNDWSNNWHDGIFPFHHFHSIAHEVLGIAAGWATVAFGGPKGRAIEVRSGDVVVIPAGVGHCRCDTSTDLLVVGAYPGGADHDLCRGEPAHAERVRRNIAVVSMPAADPVDGRDGPLLRLWRRR